MGVLKPTLFECSLFFDRGPFTQSGMTLDVRTTTWFAFSLCLFSFLGIARSDYCLKDKIENITCLDRHCLFDGDSFFCAPAEIATWSMDRFVVLFCMGQSLGSGGQCLNFSWCKQIESKQPQETLCFSWFRLSRSSKQWGQRLIAMSATSLTCCLVLSRCKEIMVICGAF